MNVCMYRHLLLMMLTIRTALSTCKRTVIKSYEKHVCDHYCRNVYYAEAEYFCTNTSLYEIDNYLTSNTDTRISLNIYNSAISILDAKLYSWEALHELYLRYTNTEKLLPGYFNKLTKLEVLEITNNDLQGLIDGSLSPLSVLVRLNLTRNSITHISEHCFSGLSSLENLDLSNNKISVIAIGAFSTLKNLKYVNLTKNLIQTTEGNFKGNKLIFLDVSYNLLKEVALFSNDTDKSLEFLSVAFDPSGPSLNLSHNKLHVIDSQTVSFRLTSADYSNNILTTISSDAFKNSSHLSSLYLNNNNLTYLPRELFQDMKNLLHLDVSFNRISTVPLGLFNYVQRLEFLDLSDNEMMLDLYSLSTLRKLKVLKFNHNKIQNFDLKLITNILSNLKQISLDDDMFSCSELVHVISEFHSKKVTVIHGNNMESNNILGISCTDVPDSKKELITLRRGDENGQEADPSQNFFQRFFNVDFKNTTFYKFFTNYGSTAYQNLPLFQYLNRNFSDTNFYKYLEGFQNDPSISSGLSNLTGSLLKKLESLNLENQKLSQSDLTTISTAVKSLQLFLQDFERSMKDVSRLNTNVERMLTMQNATLEYIARYFENYSDKSNAYSNSKFDSLLLSDNHDLYEASIHKSLVAINVLLSFILICILAFIYFRFIRQNIAILPSRENLQLM